MLAVDVLLGTGMGVCVTITGGDVCSVGARVAGIVPTEDTTSLDMIVADGSVSEHPARTIKKVNYYRLKLVAWKTTESRLKALSNTLC